MKKSGNLMSSKIKISTKDVSVFYNQNQALNNITFDIAEKKSNVPNWA